MENFSKFWKHLRAGINPNENIVAQMASVSIFAFIDKEGIVTESQKYVDEIAVIDKKGEKQVIDLLHHPLIKREDKIYEFENKAVYERNIHSLKALGLSFMHAKNPQISDTCKQLQEMFIMDKLPIKSKFV